MGQGCANVALTSDKIDSCYGRRGRFRATKKALYRAFRYVATGRKQPKRSPHKLPTSHTAERHGSHRTQNDERSRLAGTDPMAPTPPGKSPTATHFLSDEALWAVRLGFASNHHSAMSKLAESGRDGTIYEATVKFHAPAGEGIASSSGKLSEVHAIQSVTITVELYKGYWYEIRAFPNAKG